MTLLLFDQSCTYQQISHKISNNPYCECTTWRQGLHYTVQYIHHHQLTTTIATSYDVIWISVAANQIADHNHVRHDIDPVMGQHTYTTSFAGHHHNTMGLFRHLMSVKKEKKGSAFLDQYLLETISEIQRPFWNYLTEMEDKNRQ